MKAICYNIGNLKLTLGKLYPVIIITATQGKSDKMQFFCTDDNSTLINLTDDNFWKYFMSVEDWR